MKLVQWEVIVSFLSEIKYGVQSNELVYCPGYLIPCLIKKKIDNFANSDIIKP